MYVKSDLVKVQNLYSEEWKQQGQKIPELRKQVDPAPKVVFQQILLLIWMTIMGFLGSSYRQS